MATPTQEQIDDVLIRAAESVNSGESKFPDLTYEHGVLAGIWYVQGEVGDPLSK